MSHPKTYKAAQFVEKDGPLKLVDIDWKDPRPGEVVVKVLACGVCHSDSFVQNQMMHSGLPRTPGHEIIGDVAAVGDGEKHWKVGDRVGSGWHGGHDGACQQCRKGDFILCENENINGVLTDGGYAEYATLRTEAIAAVPKEMDVAEAAPLLCAGVTCYNSLRHMDALPGDTVAVQGLGGLGHLALQISQKMGFKTVALSSSGAKEKMARQFGAHEYIDGSKVDQTEALQKLGGAKVVMCTAPNPDVIKNLVNALAPDGTLLVLALVPELPIPGPAIISKRLSIRGWPSGSAADSEDTLSFAQTTGVHCRVEKYPLKDAQKAYDNMMSGKANFRGVLIP